MHCLLLFSFISIFHFFSYNTQQFLHKSLSSSHQIYMIYRSIAHTICYPSIHTQIMCSSKTTTKGTCAHHVKGIGGLFYVSRR
jgi:hypothetical protein